MIDLDKLRESEGYMLAIVNTQTGEYEPVSEDVMPVKHGKWIYSNDFHWYVASCNKCGYQRRTDIKAEGWNQWNYCPNCGARMVEE